MLPPDKTAFIVRIVAYPLHESPCKSYFAGKICMEASSLLLALPHLHAQEVGRRRANRRYRRLGLDEVRAFHAQRLGKPCMKGMSSLCMKDSLQKSQHIGSNFRRR